MRAATKVGIAVLLAVFAFVSVRYYLLGFGWRNQTYVVRVRFKDVRDLDEGSYVRMAGVRIGTVQRIDLVRTPDNRMMAEVVLQIVRRYRIPKNSVFRISSGGLIGEKYVDILPGTSAAVLPQKQEPAEEDVVYGVETPQLEDLITKASKFADETSRIAENINSVAGSIESVVRDLRLGKDLRAVLANAERATRRADALIADLRNLVAANRPYVSQATQNIAETTEGFKEMANVIRDLVTEANLKETLEKTLANVQKATENIERASANIEKLTADEKMREDLRATIANLRQTAENTKEITLAVNETVNRLLGRRRRESGQQVGPPPPVSAVTGQTSFDVYQTVSPGRFRLDVNRVQPLSGGRFAYFGLRDVGETTRINLQLGQSLSRSLDVRYGFYASRLGVGLDYNLTGPTGFSLNLYRPNDLQVDIYGKTRLRDDLSLYFGVESAFRRNIATFGLQFRR
jgi:phospholipid/cholesterol/gamma-HCH transport system substrate-binding protein